MDALEDGAEALGNARHERFAQLIVQHPHEHLRRLWAMSSPVPVDETASHRGMTASGSRAKRNPETAARIRYLTREARTSTTERDSGSLATNTLEKSMMRLSEALRSCYDRLKTEGAKEADLSRLRKTIADHVGRFATKLKTLRRVDGPQASEPMSPVPVMFRKARFCECNGHD